MAWRPSKWLTGSPVALLPFVAAFWFNSGAIHDDLTNRVMGSLAAAKADWAKISVDGRDVLLSGDAPSDDAVAAAVNAVTGTFGVRLAQQQVHVLPPLAAPTIDKLQGRAGTLTATGTWPEGVASTLRATLAGRSWVLGKDADFTSAGTGRWQLKLPADLAPGTYDLAVAAGDAAGRSVSDASKDEITVAAPPEMMPPTIESVESNSAIPEVNGTWPSAVATKLTVTVDKTPYVLGSNGELTANADAWSLKLAKPLPDGTFDVTAEVSDGTRTVKSAAPAHILVDTTPPAAPEVTPATVTAQPFTVTGKWAEGDAVSLIVKLADRMWTLGQGKALTSDGKGNWSLTPDMVLQPGTYDLGVETRDRLGNAAVINAKGAVVIPQPPAMQVPTIESVESNSPMPEIKGTWPSGLAKSLTVTLGQTQYLLGRDAELTSNGDAWALKPSKPLPDGTLDVMAEASDGVRSVVAAAPGHVLIDTTPPAAPKIAPIAITGQPFTITGTWAEGDAVSLVAKLADKVWTLGTDKALASDGKGTWSLTPNVTLDPGTYDLGIETRDKLGNLSSVTAKRAVVIPQPAPTPAAAAPATPTVALYNGTESPAAVSGTWDSKSAVSLKVGVAGTAVQAVLGSDAALTANGDQWTLALGQKLAPGSYDVTVETANKDGRISRDQTKFEILVKEPAAPPPPPPPPKSLAAPVIAPYAGEASPAAITGTWDEANAEKLTVGIPAVKLSATLGDGKALTSDGKGKWALAITAPLPPGIYDVAAVETAKDGRSASDASTAEIYIKAPPAPPPAPPPPPKPLAAPAIAPYAGEASPTSITGTWDEGNAETLTVGIPAVKLSAALGADKALTSDGKGNWALAITAPLTPGIYDVTAVETAKDGRSASDASTAEIYIKAAPPPPPPPSPSPPPAFDCGPPLADLQAATPIEFGFDSVAIEAPHDTTVQKIAALLNDPRCKDVKVHVAGRADFYGDRRYNIALSIRRAQAVVNALAAAGVDAGRLSVDGYGTDQPLGPDHSDAARIKNRSVIVTIVK